MEPPSKCAICSAPTQSWRYEALACNVCANFFRRNVLKKRKRMFCNGGGLLDLKECFHKHRCQSCRLKLCVAVGMSERAVLFNAESRRIAKEEREGIKKENEEKQIIVFNPHSNEVVIDRVLGGLRHRELAFDRLRKSTFNPLPRSVLSLNEALKGSSKMSTDFGMETWPNSYPSGYEDNSGSLLENVFRRIGIGLARKNYESNRKSWYFANVIFALEYFKSFDVFNNLEPATRRLLAGKMTFLCTNLTNLYYSIKMGKSHLVFPDGLALYAGMQTGFEKDMERTSTWINSVRDMQLDETEFALLKVLLIMSPSLEDASTEDRALLMNQSECYAKILFSYVMARRGSERGPRSYQEMLALIETINNRVRIEKQVQVFALGMFQEMCPLLAEIVML